MADAGIDADTVDFVERQRQLRRRAQQGIEQATPESRRRWLTGKEPESNFNEQIEAVLEEVAPDMAQVTKKYNAGREVMSAA